MTIPASGMDYPTVAIGGLGHPSTFAWSFIEKSRGTFDFRGFDAYVNAAQSHGLVDQNGAVEVVITFGLTPGWAAADQSTCSFEFGITQCTGPPANIQDWKDFVTAVVGHYNGVTAPHVKFYELWNEVTARNFWTGTTQELVDLAAAAYPIIHTDPFSLLLTPSVTGPVTGSAPTNSAAWMASYLQAGGAQYADGGSFHGYIARTGVSPYPMPEQDATAGCPTGGDACYGSIITKETAMRAAFDQNGLAGKPMFDTEGSWGLTSNVTDADTQTAWLARWLILQACYYPKIAQVSWYSWGYAADPTSLWGDIESSPGVASEAGVAYAQVYQWLVGSTFTSPCSGDSNGTWSCPLILANGHQGLIVWNVNGPTSYTPSGSFPDYRDLAGNSGAVGASVSIGTKPILLES